MRKIKKSKSTKKRKILTILYLCLAILILVVGVLLIFSLDISSKDNTENFSLMDECSFIMGNLIHLINSKDECALRCVTECNFRGKEMTNSSFSYKNGSCNTCDCFCK